MGKKGKAWTVRDRYSNEVYLTWERWYHILERHDEMEDYFDELRQTVETARRWQDPRDPDKYFYIKWFEGLMDWNNCIVAVVIVKPAREERFVVTAHQDYIIKKG